MNTYNGKRRIFGIERIGSGKRTRYTIKHIVENGTNPIGYATVYKTEEEARQGAKTLGIEVDAVGDLYELLAAYARLMMA